MLIKKSARPKPSQLSSTRVQIWAAIFGVIGTIGVAALTNWDKITATSSKSANLLTPPQSAIGSLVVAPTIVLPPNAVPSPKPSEIANSKDVRPQEVPAWTAPVALGQAASGVRSPKPSDIAKIKDVRPQEVPAQTAPAELGQVASGVQAAIVPESVSRTENHSQSEAQSPPNKNGLRFGGVYLHKGQYTAISGDLLTSKTYLRFYENGLVRVGPFGGGLTSQADYSEFDMRLLFQKGYQGRYELNGAELQITFNEKYARTFTGRVDNEGLALVLENGVSHESGRYVYRGK